MLAVETMDLRIHPRHMGECFLSISFMDLAMSNPFSDSNANYYAYCVGSYLSFLDDSPCGPKPLRTVTRFKNALMEDFIGVVKSNSELADLFLKTPAGEYLVEFRRTPIYYEYMRWRVTQRPDLFTYILSFLMLLKKAKFERPDLATVAYKQWLSDEAALEAPLPAPDLLADLKAVMEYFLLGFEVGFHFRHGPGFTADIPNRDIFAKSALALTPRIERYLRSLPSPDPCRTTMSVLGHVVLDDRRVTSEKHRGARPRPVLGATFTKRDTPAELRFVYKNAKTMRSMCMEPADHMMAQQNLLRSFYELFASHEFLRHSIHIESQEFNRRGALLGAMFHTLDTIDLSSASDLVGLDLVRAIFPRSVFRHLLGTRSSHVNTPTGETLRLRKMAPMGSAVCFPVQCLVFLCVTVVAEMRNLQRQGLIKDMPRSTDEVRHALSLIHVDWDHNDPRYVKGKFLTPLVFGDDIVCDSKVTGDVMDLLRSLRFRINVEKSFTGSDSVRESCGLYSYEGAEVTPFLVKTPMFYASMTAVHTASVQRNYEVLQEYGYRHLGDFIFSFWRWHVDVDVSHLLPFATATEMFFGFVERWNPDYQRAERVRLGVSDLKSPAGWYRSEAYQFMIHADDNVVEASFDHPTRVSESQRHRAVWEPLD